MVDRKTGDSRLGFVRLRTSGTGATRLFKPGNRTSIRDQVPEDRIGGAGEIFSLG